MANVVGPKTWTRAFLFLSKFMFFKKFGNEIKTVNKSRVWPTLPLTGGEQGTRQIQEVKESTQILRNHRWVHSGTLLWGISKLYLNVLEYTFEKANRKIPTYQTHMSECLNQKRDRGFQTRRLTGKKNQYKTNRFFLRSFNLGMHN